MIVNLCLITSIENGAFQTTCPWVSVGPVLHFLWLYKEIGMNLRNDAFSFSFPCFVHFRRFIKNGLHWKTNWNNFVQSQCCDILKSRVTVDDLVCQDLSFVWAQPLVIDVWMSKAVSSTIYSVWFSLLHYSCIFYSGGKNVFNWLLYLKS